MSTEHDVRPIIPRHKTAIRRADLSLPVKCLLRDGLLDRSKSLFDYGCGLGQDIDRLQEMGIPSTGWDPVHRPAGPQAAAAVVNLGYVINVIENPQERTEVLRRAWELCESLLVVSALSASDLRNDRTLQEFGDGILTSRGTFQKHYTHQELRNYLEAELPTDAVPAAPNVFYLFKSDERRQQLLASRFRRRIAVPPRRLTDVAFDDNQHLLVPFMAALTKLGRLPGPQELPEHSGLVERFGSLKRAFLVVRRVTGNSAWAEIADRRREDVLVYLALARFGRRQPLSKLPMATQLDIKAFFGTYRRGCEAANTLLFSVGQPVVIDQACQRSPVGCLVENALVVNRNSLVDLEPVLRVYEGCARAILGEVEEANVIKLHRTSGKVTYLACKDLDCDPDPTLTLRIKVTLTALSIDVFDYSRSVAPPRLGLHPDLLRRAVAGRTEGRVCISREIAS